MILEQVGVLRGSGFARGALLAGLAAGLAAGLVVSVGAQEPVARSQTFTFERLNRTYDQDRVDLAPMQQGPWTLRLSSPQSRVILKGHRLTLTPLGEGLHQAVLELEFMGKGFLVANMEMAGVSRRMEDELLVPRQTRTLTGTLRLVRGEGGYQVTTVSLPATVEVTIQSRLAIQLVNWCDQISVVPLLPLNCGALEGALSSVNVPLPPPGETYLLPDEELTEEDRQELVRYLAGRTGNR